MKQEESSLRTKEEVDIRKIRKNKKWWKNYRNAKLKMRLWYERKDVKLCRRRRRRMGIETYVISKQWCSSFAHTINTFTYTCGSEELRKTSGRKKGKITLNKNIESLFGRFTNSVCFWYSLVEWHIPPSRLQATFYYYTYCITFSLLLTVLCLCTDTWIESFGFRRISSNESFHLIPINNRTLFIEAGVMCKCVPFIQNCQNICGNVIRSYILTNDFSFSPRKQILNLNCMA